MTHGPEGPPTLQTQVSLVTTEGDSERWSNCRRSWLAWTARGAARQPLRPAQAGAHIWGDALLVKRFRPAQPHRQPGDPDGYRHEVRRFMWWHRNHLDLAQGPIHRWPRTGWTSFAIEAERMKPDLQPQRRPSASVPMGA